MIPCDLCKRIISTDSECFLLTPFSNPVHPSCELEWENRKKNNMCVMCNKYPIETKRFVLCGICDYTMPFLDY